MDRRHARRQGPLTGGAPPRWFFLVLGGTLAVAVGLAVCASSLASASSLAGAK